MPHAKALRRKECWAAFCLLVLVPAHGWAEASEVVAKRGRLASVELAAYDSEREPRAATLRVEGENREISGLVRWGEPAEPQSRATLLLADGSRLLSDRTWSPAGLVLVDGDQVKLRRGRGFFNAARESVRWLMTETGQGDPSLDDFAGEVDEVLLTGGDRLTGRVVALTSKELRLESGEETLTTPRAAVAAIRFAGDADRPNEPTCLVGLVDGSLLRADRLKVADGRYTLGLSGSRLAGRADELTLVQPFGGSVQYLSDLEPVDYQHTPYLDLTWPYTRDIGLRGEQLTGGGARRAKGLAMHSAARLVYRLDGAAQRFRADLAVGDPPVGSAVRGSVVFRVYLVLEGAFASAYESPVIRAGDPPTPIDLDVTDAAAIALVIDYADGGDAGDEALWLDARLVRGR